MCSIAGYACTRHLADEAIESTLALMRRRGPDHAAYRRFVAPSGRETCLLHSRLSIIDLDPRSSQPFQSGATWLTYNGELYLNAHVHLHLCMLDGVVAQGRQGLVFRGARVDEACVERSTVYRRRRTERSGVGNSVLQRRHVRRSVSNWQTLAEPTEFVGLPMLWFRHFAFPYGTRLISRGVPNKSA